ncbi:MAG: hypothetical protein ACJ73J_08055, partial [Actinomycetes bacterium]
KPLNTFDNESHGNGVSASHRIAGLPYGVLGIAEVTRRAPFDTGGSRRGLNGSKRGRHGTQGGLRRAHDFVGRTLEDAIGEHRIQDEPSCLQLALGDGDGLHRLLLIVIDVEGR